MSSVSAGVILPAYGLQPLFPVIQFGGPARIGCGFETKHPEGHLITSMVGKSRTLVPMEVLSTV